MLKSIGIVLALFILFPFPAGSEVREGAFEVSPFFGKYFYGGDQNLRSEPVFGVRLGYNFTRNIGIEASLEQVQSSIVDRLKTSADRPPFVSPDDGVKNILYHIDAVYHFMPGQRLNPFVVAGIGESHFDPSRTGTVSRFLADFGAGAKYWLTDTTAVRVDMRDVMTFDKTYHNIQATVGLVMSFGGKAGAAMRRAAEPSIATKTQAEKEAKARAEDEAKAEAEAEAKAKEKARVEDEAKAKAKAKDKADAEAKARVEDEAKAKADDEAKAAAKAEKVIILEDIHFDFDKATLTSDAKRILKKNVAALKENPGAKVRIEGHACAHGSEDYNLRLSERRAHAVREYLVKDGGVAPERLSTIAYGETRLAMPETPTPENKNSKEAKANRRAHFEITVR